MARRRSYRRSQGRSAPRRAAASSSSSHMPLLLLLGGAAGYYLYDQNKKQAAIRSLSTVPPALAASQTIALPQDQLTQDLDTINALAPLPLSGLQPSGALPGMGAWRQPSGALPGMGSFHLSHVINNVIAKPIAQLTSGPLKVPLAIMTLGQSAVLAKGVEAANAGITAVISKIDDPILKARQMVMSVVGGKAQAPANTAGTTITYLDCNGTAIDLPTIQAQLSALAAVGGATSITPVVDANGNAVYRMPACPPAPGTTPYPAQPVGNPTPIITQAPPVSAVAPIYAPPAAQVPYQDAYSATGGGGYSYTDPATANVNIDPTTGLPYASAPVATATTPDPAVAPVTAKPISWLTVAGVALAVPAIMYVAHK